MVLKLEKRGVYTMEKIKKKKRKPARYVPAAFLSAALLSGCCSVTLQQPEQQRRCGEILAESFCGNDPETFTSPLSGAMKKEFGKKEFINSRKKVCGAMGDPVSKQFVGKLAHPFLDIELWKISFKRKNQEGKEIVQDALFQVVSATENGEQKVISFGFL